MLIAVSARYRFCRAGYVWSDALPTRGFRSASSNLSIGEVDGRVEWRTLDPSTINMAHEIAGIDTGDREDVQAFIERWGLPMQAEGHSERAWLKLSAFAELVRHIRRALALADNKDLEALARHFKRHAHVECAVRCQPNGTDRLEIGLECADLASLAWCQITQETVPGREDRRCGWCGTPFVAGHDAHRRSRKYCSDRCRVAAHRAKRRGSGGQLNPQ